MQVIDQDPVDGVAAGYAVSGFSSMTVKYWTDWYSGSDSTNVPGGEADTSARQGPFDNEKRQARHA